ncbi:MAG: aspartate-semialdehyde dehydrogenase [Ignavibacteria bacterium]|nr:aspartate-semialdehyde dehydrogenase [Ignavibacteria bacterium]
MSSKIKVGILGCTGAVGQKLISLLGNHPLFRVTEVAASDNSAGIKYAGRVNWKESSRIPDSVKELTIKKCSDVLDAELLFSGLDSSAAGGIEDYYAGKGYVVVSNSKNHRMGSDIPLIIPEVNSEHFGLIEKQKEKYNSGGYIVTNPNCSTVVLAVTLFPVYKNFGLKKVLVTTMQAVSGAGYPGISSMDILGNVIPHINDEEEKMQIEPLKIFGKFEDGKIKFADFKISAMCNRVPVRDGHTMSISFETEKRASKDEIISALGSYDNLNLPSSPELVLKYTDDPFRPQPLLDIDTGNGMTVTAGNLRKCGVLEWKINAFGHNTIRGAAGAAILNAEYLIKNNLVK